ncbi:MFS transporter [Pseudomonas tolaasii]
MSESTTAYDSTQDEDRAQRRVIVAASVGTIFEYYDFTLYAALAVFFGGLFFPAGNEVGALLVSLATYAAGFAIRPIGGLVFGRLGDRVGRKFTFLVTIVVMGLSTAAVGFLPTFETIGWAAPVALVALRLLQGLALGGEYGGAAVFVAEHAASNRRGTATGWVQCTATLGFVLSLVVIVLCRSTMDATSFSAWGWRIPFIASLLLLVLSVYVRAKLQESPVFLRMKRERGTEVASPIRDALTNRKHLKLILIATFGGVAAMASTWTVSQAYTLIYMINTLKLDYKTAYLLCAVTFGIGTILYALFGALSDRVGRKPIMLGGAVLFVVTALPCYQALTSTINPVVAQFAEERVVKVVGPTSECHFNLFAAPKTECDRVRDLFTRAGVSFDFEMREDVTSTVTVVGQKTFQGFNASALNAGLASVGYREQVNLGMAEQFKVGLIVIVLMLSSAMTFAPLGAYLVELFPTHIRYTALSLPYNIGNTLFAGLVPFVGFATVTLTGNIYAALYYPLGIVFLSIIVGIFLMPETNGRDLFEMDGKTIE